jgi:hypothetical protein
MKTDREKLASFCTDQTIALVNVNHHGVLSPFMPTNTRSSTSIKLNEPPPAFPSSSIIDLCGK